MQLRHKIRNLSMCTILHRDVKGGCFSLLCEAPGQLAASWRVGSSPARATIDHSAEPQQAVQDSLTKKLQPWQQLPRARRHSSSAVWLPCAAFRLPCPMAWRA